MAWGNMEVQSVEIVQDMSYDVLLKRMREKYKLEGMLGVYNEVVENFGVALYLIEKINDFDSLILQCEDALSILISTLYISIEICCGETCLLSDSYFEIIESRCLKNNELNVAMLKILKECEKDMKSRLETFIELDKTIENEKGKLVSYKLINDLNIYLGRTKGASVFQLFSNNVLQLADIVEEKIQRRYGRSEKNLIDETIRVNIAYNAYILNKNKYNKYLSTIEKFVEQIADSIWYQSKRDIIEHPFITILSKYK